MARINLLPWREERRKQRQKEFGVMLAGSALGAVLLSFLIVSFYSGQISGQNERNAYLRDRITEVDKQIKEIEELDKKKAKLLARKEVIEQLQANRSQMVHLFDSLVRTIPDGINLTSLKQSDRKLQLKGLAQSSTRVASYMRNIEASEWLTDPSLDILETKGAGEGGSEFTLNAVQENPALANANADQQVAATPAGPAGARRPPGAQQ